MAETNASQHSFPASDFSLPVYKPVMDAGWSAYKGMLKYNCDNAGG